VARRSNQPRELVRLSPLQFSLSVSIVVILLGAAALGGYYYGLKQHTRSNSEAGVSSAGDISGKTDSKPAPGDTQASVTFYSALKKPRKEVPTASPPPPVEPARTPVKTVPAPPAVPAVPRLEVPVPGSGSATLQVASYKDQANARKLLHDLSSEGYAGTVVRTDLGERGVWFRVRIGPYAEKDTAGILQKLRDERKLKGFVVK